MKITRLAIHNINSLKGTHEIDFASGALAAAGLYAIVGPTGAGKSTILDAILLALYGKTERESNPQNLMTRGTGECFVEVDYETVNGRYRNRWERRRARNKANGKLQSPRMELRKWDARAENYAPLGADRPTEIKTLTVEIIGISYENFVRAVMLTQGEFARFLASSESDKSAVLERITGTEIYRAISAKAFERHKSAREEYEKLERASQAMQPLAEEERRQLETSIAERREEALLLRARQKKLRVLENAHAETERLATERKTVTEEVAITETRLKATEATLQPLTEAEEAARQKLAEFNEKLPARLDNIRRAAALETELATLESVHKSRAAGLSALSRDCSAEQARIKQFTSEKTDLERRLEGKNAAELEREIAVGETQLAELDTQLNRLRQAAERAQLAKKTSTAEAEKIHAEAAEQHATTQLVASQKMLAHRQTVLENIRRAQGLNPYRDELVTGEPCPLCGSRNHPLADHTWTDDNLVLAQSDLKQAEAEAHQAQTAATSATATQAAARATLDQLQQRLAAFPPDLPPADPAALTTTETQRATLHGRLQTLRGQRDAAGRLREVLTALSNHEKQLDLFRKQLEREDREGEERQKKIAEVTTAKEALIGKYNSGACRQMLDERLAKRTAELEKARNAREAATSSRLRAATRLKELAARRDSLVESHATATAALDGQPARADNRRALDATAAELSQLDQQIGGLTTRLGQDDERRLSHSIAAAELDKRRAELTRWARLNDLVGSAKGDKFARFAQSLTLRRLVAAANHHLDTIYPRFVIDHVSAGADAPDGLELEIVDRHLGDSRRPVTTLSGGETFLVSLALALGLSDLARGRADVKSLFIDEGFGTLDDRVLDRAITALEALHNQGKSIGLISHVRELKERITTQIEVVPLGNGISTLRVPD